VSSTDDATNPADAAVDTAIEYLAAGSAPDIKRAFESAVATCRHGEDENNNRDKGFKDSHYRIAKSANERFWIAAAWLAIHTHFSLARLDFFRDFGAPLSPRPLKTESTQPSAFRRSGLRTFGACQNEMASAYPYIQESSW
jgi:hypothetical protein